MTSECLREHIDRVGLLRREESYDRRDMDAQKKAKGTGTISSNLLRETISGGSEQAEAFTTRADVFREDWMSTLSKQFSGACISRSVLHSVDNEGQRISRLPPYKEITISFPLFKHEIDNLEEMAAQSSSSHTRHGKVHNL